MDYRLELKLAYARKKQLEEVSNIIDPMFIDEMTYRLKAIDTRIDILLKKIREMKEDEKNKMDKSKKNDDAYWREFILSICRNSN